MICPTRFLREGRPVGGAYEFVTGRAKGAPRFRATPPISCRVYYFGPERLTLSGNTAVRLGLPIRIVPAMYHTAVVPSVMFCQMMSGVLSPLRSITLEICQS